MSDRLTNWWRKVLTLPPGQLYLASFGALAGLLIGYYVWSDVLDRPTVPEKLGIGVLAAFGVATAILRAEKSRTFSDVDKEKIERRLILEKSALLVELQKRIEFEKALALQISGKPKADSEPPAAVSKPTTFESFFREADGRFQEHIDQAEAKASLLLDKGRFYVWVGILFYLTAIIVWQSLVATQGFKSEYIYGIAASSFLFVFVEFLSAWYLRQYRHFADSADYVVKLRSVFNRYFLAWLACQTADPAKPHTDVLIDILSDSIHWPPDAHMKKPDLTYTRDLFESFAAVTSAARKPRKSDKEKKEKKSDDDE